MGLTHVTASIEGLERTGQSYEATFLVDTGAFDCLAPTSVLVKAGVCEEGREIYELANGEPVELAWGWARIRFMDLETINKIVFGPEAAEPLLGVMALEGAGVIVDPKTQTLRRLARRSLKKVAVV
jgi:clan AA aspartic protease